MRYGTIRFFEERQKLMDGVVFSAEIAFLHRRSGVPLRGLVLLLKWSNILVFFCLVFYCIIFFVRLFPCLYFIFIVIFVTEAFERLSGRNCPESCHCVML